MVSTMTIGMPAAALALQGRNNEAQEARDMLYELWPDFTMNKFAKMVHVDSNTLPNRLEGLRKAGFTFPDASGETEKFNDQS